MNSTNLLMFVVLSAGMLTALSATTLSVAVPAYADEKHCEDNGDDNCNDTEHTDKVKAKDECDNYFKNKDHSDDNTQESVLICEAAAANLEDAVLINSSVFDITD